MQLTLRDLCFPIKYAELSAAISDPHWLATFNPKGDPRLYWHLELKAEPIDDEEMWEPLVYHQKLHFPVARWQEVAGQIVEWSSAVDPVSNEPNGAFYVVEHGPITQGRICFHEREGTRFRFTWEGKCDVYWDEKYCQDVPFFAEAWAEFTGVKVRGSETDTDLSLRERLAHYLDINGFEQGPFQRGSHTYNDGVGMANADFKPKSIGPD